MSLAEGGGGDDQLFTDLLNGHGLGSGDAFTGLPDITGGGGLWDGGGGGGGDLSGAGFLGEDGPGAAAERETARVEARAGADASRDSSGSAAGRASDVKADGGAGPSGPSGSFALSLEDYASLERVGTVNVDDFLGPIVDDGAIATYAGDGGWGGDRGEGSGFAGAPGSGVHVEGLGVKREDGGEVSKEQREARAAAMAQAQAQAHAMQHARGQGMVGPGGMRPVSGPGAPMAGMGPGAPMRGLPPHGLQPLPPGTHGMPPPQPGMEGAGPGPVPGPNGMLYFPGPPMPMLHLGGPGGNKPPSRLERLRRWKEKRKNRNFNKTIRYQSRKVCADNRPRIKGKFVKVGSTPDLGAMDDLGADLDGPKRLQNVDENGEGSLDSEGAPPPGTLARTAGLVRTGGLTAAMSVPDLTRMNVGDGSEPSM